MKAEAVRALGKSNQLAGRIKIRLRKEVGIVLLRVLPTDLDG